MWCRIDKNINMYPPRVRDHIQQRFDDRNFLLPMKKEMLRWLDTLPIAPDLDEAPTGVGWKKEFESFTIYGEGKLVKTIGTIYEPISNRPHAIDLDQWTPNQRFGRYENLTAARDFVEALYKRGFKTPSIWHTSGDSVYVALYRNPHNRRKPGTVTYPDKSVQQVLIRFSNDTTGIKEYDSLAEWNGGNLNALVERAVKFLTSVFGGKKGSKKSLKSALESFLGAMKEDKFEDVDTHPGDLGLAKWEPPASNGMTTFWHGTSWERAETILRQGINASGGGAEAWDDGNQYVWLTLCPIQAGEYGKMRNEHDDGDDSRHAVVVIRWPIDKTEADPEHGDMDEPFEDGVEYASHRRTPYNIPRSSIKEVIFYENNKPVRVVRKP